jgi:hypothetical protein
VIGGEQRNRGVNHGNGFGHHTGAPSKAGAPMAQPTVDTFHRHGLIFPPIMSANGQKAVIGSEFIGAIQRDVPAFQALQQSVQRGGITIAAFPVNEASASAIKSQPDPEFVLFFLRKCHSSSNSITTTSSPGSG